MSRKGFTIFEVLAVLTVIGIALVVTLGSYGSWAASHALDSATRILEAGLLNARAAAKANNTYVMVHVDMQSGRDTNTLMVVDGFTLYTCVCTNDITDPRSLDFDLAELPTIQITSQRLNRHVTVWLSSGWVFSENLVFFCPDGSLLTAADQNLYPKGDPEPAEFWVGTRKPFASSSQPRSAPLYRAIRVDPATGFPTICNPESLSGGGQNANP